MHFLVSPEKGKQYSVALAVISSSFCIIIYSVIESCPDFAYKSFGELA